MMLPWALITVLLLSHGLCLAPLFTAVRADRVPRPLDVVGISVIIYFDLGVGLEVCGLRIHSSFFHSIFDASDSQVIIAGLLIAAAPWLMRLGSLSRLPVPGARLLRLRDGARRRWLYIVVVAVSAICAFVPGSLLVVQPRLRESRELLGRLLGPYIIVLSLPMYLLAFLVRVEELRTRWGRVFLGVVATSAVLATVFAGQRTLVLLPMLMLLFFGGKFSWKRTVGVAIGGATLAAFLLQPFKSSSSENTMSAAELFEETVGNDFYRGPELVRAVGMASAFGPRSVDYAGAGYVYAALFFVPRSVVPFKGNATAQAFTAEVTQSDPRSLDWGFGISAISEAVLNFGLVIAPIVLVAYGAVIGWLERRCERWQSLQIPLLLASLWIFGYHLPALLLNFGAMAAVGIGCEKFFTEQSGGGFAECLVEGRAQ
ncbi:hypothetical protein [Candidatus Korobacter versatilis]|nr:hypothetical protein [Candidatus Koribacter versatilis]